MKDDQQRVLMGAPVMHSSGFIRCSYRSRGYSPNFKLFAWGLRTAADDELIDREIGCLIVQVHLPWHPDESVCPGGDGNDE